MGQVDYPEDENFEQDLNLDEIVQGLNWYATFQVQQMLKRKRRDGHSSVFIDKLEAEMKQTQYVIYTEFQKYQRDEQEAPEITDLFQKLSLPALCQLLGTFMPIIKLKQADSYLIGTEVKKMMVRGEKCMIRVGGGYADIAQYYNDYSTK